MLENRIFLLNRLSFIPRKPKPAHDVFFQMTELKAGIVYTILEKCTADIMVHGTNLSFAPRTKT